jgi:glycosyltransferase involved in cell wall biosynthesis
MRVALVHDWLAGVRGGEKVLEVFCELYPQADLHTLLHVPGSCSKPIERMNIKTSFIQHLPGVARHYRRYLPLFPHAIESFDFRGYDLVLSSSHCVAKGVITPPTALHVSYVHTPMRYVWDQFPDYFGPGRAGLPTRVAARVAAPFLRAWDEASANRVDHYIANSTHVADRVRKRYRRDAHVIHPPVDLSRFQPVSPEHVEDYYLMVGAFAPYKRVDLAIEAFKKMNRRLKIVGGGQDLEHIRKLAGGPVELLGNQPDEVVAQLYAHCKAFVFPGEEDFGITPLEAQASGRPVIAYGKGGVLDTVLPLATGNHPATGVFFARQTVDDLIDAVRRFEAVQDRFDPAFLRAHAESFDRPHFRRKLEVFLRSLRAEPVEPVWPTRPALA